MLFGEFTGAQAAALENFAHSTAQDFANAHRRKADTEFDKFLQEDLAKHSKWLHRQLRATNKPHINHVTTNSDGSFTTNPSEVLETHATTWEQMWKPEPTDNTGIHALKEARAAAIAQNEQAHQVTPDEIRKGLHRLQNDDIHWGRQT